jgi:hypothetical protein
VVDQRKKESLFFGKKLTRFGQLWVVGVWDLRATRGMYVILTLKIGRVQRGVAIIFLSNPSSRHARMDIFFASLPTTRLCDY